MFGRSVMLFENVDRGQLAALGEVRTAEHRRFVCCRDETGIHSCDGKERSKMTAQPNPRPLFSGNREVSGLAHHGAPTRPFFWSVWRELWENRSIYLAPLIVAAVQVFGFADQHNRHGGAQARGVVC